MTAATLAQPVAPTAKIPSSRFPGWLRTAILTVCAVLGWLYLLSFPQGLPLPNLDQSWSAIVTRACAEHWAFGREIMLNYGPWSHLGTGFYYAPLFTANYVFQLLSKAVVVAMICRLGAALPAGLRWAFFAANLVTGMLEWEYFQTLTIMYAGWLVSEDRTRAGRAAGGAGVVLAGAAAMMKTFYFVFGQGVFVCVLARQVLRGRGDRRSWLAGLWPVVLFNGGFLLNWLLTGQSLADLPAYARGTLALTDGHSRAMGFDAPWGIFILALVLFLWTGGLGALWLRRGPRETRLAALPLAALFAGGLFMAWKQGLTRADRFHLSGYFCFIAVLVTTVPLFFEHRAFSKRWYYGSVAGVWLLALAGITVVRPSQELFAAHELVDRGLHNLAVIFRPAAERRRLDALVEQIRADNVLPRTRAAVGRARIDFFGTDQGVLLLNDLNYAPVPTLQGFLAYTPYLAEIDARCYAPDRAPEFVLFKLETIDGRWDSLDGALELREILWNYQPVVIEKHCLLLRRKPAASCFSPQPVLRQQGEVAFDAPLPLPPDGADWCELEVHRTLLGRLVNFFYHEPVMLLETTTREGAPKISTLPPIMAQGGFLLRQCPQTAGDMAHLFTGQPFTNPVTSIRLGGDDLLRATVGETVTYRFYHLDPPRPMAN